MSKIDKINIAKTVCFLVSQKINDKNEFTRRLYSVTKAEVIKKKNKLHLLKISFQLKI